MQNIIFIAPPAAGKGTLSAMIEKKYNIPHISIGQLFRDMLAIENEETLKIKTIMEQGKMVDDEITNKLIEDRISKSDTANGFILDGFPRDLNQAIELENILKRLGKKQGKVIYMDIDKEDALKRILGRIVCPKCQRVYNTSNVNMRPKIDSICDDCGTSLVVRGDDNAISFGKRFDTYMKETTPVIDYYRDRGILYSVKATDEPTKTFEVIEEQLLND